MIRQFTLEQLELVKPNITTSKIKTMCTELDISRMSLDKYMKGQGAKIDVYDKIINFLKDKP